MEDTKKQVLFFMQNNFPKDKKLYLKMIYFLYLNNIHQT